MRLQPFNKYRVKFGMKPYKSFEEFTGETEMAAELEKLYGHIDALEYFVGMILEKRRHPQVFGETLTEIGSPYSLKGLIGNPVSSPDWWKPSTFGGDKGMNIIKTTNLQELVCRNVEGCPDISFKVRDDIDFEPIESNLNPKDDHSSQILLNIIEGEPVEDGVNDDSRSLKKPPTSGGKTSNKDSKSEL
ncbi:prostaglandin G/H synthase 1-like [Clavelina lepadiformis]|uniref:prostaglandin G/H synthase 1-like n=1 Tax=Clavelina lepadiformis TaxID=159417 RepID=UPI004041CFA9